MRKLAVVTLSALLWLGGNGSAQDPLADVREGPSCRFCGMDRAKFAASRMVVEFDDGTRFHACSLHCVAVDLAANIDKAPVAIRVADADTQALLDAEKAYWVLGGERPGVMTKRGKWAYAEKGAAKAFARQYGGLIVDFDGAMKAAYEDMYLDTKMIRERRKAKRAAKPAAPAAPPPEPAAAPQPAPAAEPQPPPAPQAPQAQ